MTWKRPSYCDSGQCLWMWPGYRTVWVRDDAGTTLVVDREDWRQFVANLPERPR